jgi:hypothetical protein
MAASLRLLQADRTFPDGSAEHRYGEAYYVTLSPRLPMPDNEGVLFTT